MPIHREQLWKSQLKARRFLQSQAGVLLHELGHHAAANERSLVVGHLLIEALDSDATSGSFAFSDEYKKQLKVDQCAFISAAGAMTELYFCNLTGPFRLGPDIVAFCSLLKWINPTITTEALIGIWHDRYADRMGKVAGVIERNFDRCRQLCATNDYLMDGVHVIPTYILDTPYRRSEIEGNAEFEATSPLAARSMARQTFLLGRQRE
jgi:hypothetical protein